MANPRIVPQPGAASFGGTASDPVPKLCGADIELGNSILGLDRHGGTGREASRALLREVRGTPGPRPTPLLASPYGASAFPGWSPPHASATGMPDGDDVSDTAAASAWGEYDPQDWGRKFLPTNGGCIYIDLDHLEVCLPEVLSAFDHVACWHAMLRIVRDAQAQANAKLPHGQALSVLVNNSDGQGHSYGSHTDFLVSRRCFDNLFSHKLHHMLYFASYLTSSIVFTGAGKVGSENGRPRVHYQLSQRADFYEALAGPQTTYNRPLVNTRDEGLCGSASDPPSRGRRSPAMAGVGGGGHVSASRRMARLHVIFCDNTLCHVSSLLKIGVAQLVLAMIEQDAVRPGLILDEPLSALLAWSHDPTLRARARLLSGRPCTALDMQAAIRDKACWFVATGRADGLVPRAHEIIALWDDTLGHLRAYRERRRPETLAPLAHRLDWALKQRILEQAMGQQGLAWDAPELKCLDHLYSSLDETQGLYWAYERAGVVEPLVTSGQIERFVHQPPTDTRAWLRAHLLRRADPDAIVDVDWDEIRFRFRKSHRHAWSSYTYRTVPMADPLGFTLEQCGPLLEREDSLAEVAEALGAYETDDNGRRRPASGHGKPAGCLPAPVASPSDSGLEPSALEDEPHAEQGGTSHGSAAEEE